MKALNALYTKMEDLVSRYYTDPAELAGRLVDILDEAYNIGVSAARAEEYGCPDDLYDDDYQDDYLLDDYDPMEYHDPMESAEEAFAYIDECVDDYYDDSLEELYNDFSKQQEDDEMSEWANTPHDDINTELKQIDEEIKDRKIDAAIWRARELMMNKIVFNDGDSYPIHSITWEVDDNNIPVDIVISSRRKYLDYIAENHCQLGYNCNDEETHGFHEALYGRLDKFCVVDYEGKVILIS